MPRKATRTSFKPGYVGGPGRPRYSPEMKAVSEITDTKFRELAGRAALMTKDELTDRMQRKDTPVLELCVLSVLRQAVIEGDQARLESFLNRLIGKVREPPSINNGANVQVNIANIPGSGDLLAQTTRTVYAELQRLEQKQTTSGLSIEEHKSLNMLANTLLDLQARRDELTAKQRELLSKMPTEELDQLGRKLFIEAPKNEKDNPSGD